MVDISLSTVLRVLKNTKSKVSSKKHNTFLITEGENVVFLLSRIDGYDTYVSEALTYVLDLNLFPLEEPKIWLALDKMKKDTPIPCVKGYPCEFPKYVFTKNLDVATRILVAETLASWVYYSKDMIKLSEIIKIGMQRLSNGKTLQPLIIFKNLKLSQKSKDLIYFVTHIILCGSMWGQFPLPDTKMQHILAKILKMWVFKISPVQNLEVWLEILFCLDILECFEITHSYLNRTKLLFKSKCLLFNQHEAYHTYLLWAFFLNYHFTKKPLSLVNTI